MTFKVILGFWLTTVIIVALAFPIVPQPQQWYEFPVIPGLEDKARILFFHVPMSWTAVVAFVVSMLYAIRYLSKNNLDDDVKSVSSAGLDRKSTRLNSSHIQKSRMPSSA